MKKLSVWAVIGVVACALCASNLLAGQGKKKEGAAKPGVSLDDQFTKADKDGDGFLSLEEYQATLRGPGAKKAKEIFEMKDTNKDGKLSLDEFKKVTFDEFALKQGVDPGVGKVTLEDIKKAMPNAPEMAEKLFKFRDRNGDGVITKEDFVQGKQAKTGKKGGGKKGKNATG